MLVFGVRSICIVVLAVLSFVPLGLGVYRRRSLGWLAISPPIFYVLLVGVATLVDKYAVHSLAHTRYFFWVLGWLVYGFGLVFPFLYFAIFLAARRRKSGTLALRAMTLGTLLFGFLTCYATFVEPTMLAEREYEFVSELAPEEDLLVLHVSDLQTDGLCLREKKAREAIKKRMPDLVFFTGDIANDALTVRERKARIESAQLFFRSLKARLGIYAVPGDWDGWVDDWPELRDAFLEGSDVEWLNNRRVDLLGGRLAIYGVGGGPGLPGSPKPPDFSDTDGFRVVIAHHPDDIDDLVQEGGADLSFAGHTHGGQVVLPFVGALRTHTDLGFAGGIHKNHDIPIIISRGIGMRGAGAPRIRFGCKPEISWVTIRRP